MFINLIETAFARQIMETKLNQQARVIWLTGLPCSGKTTIGVGLEKRLISNGFIVRMLDGDVTRKGICNDLGFSEEDRNENIRRIAEISRLFAESGIITINAFITPTEKLRNMARDIIGSEYFINVFVNAPLKLCEQRDIKGMYKKARNGEIKEFTGVSAPFEPPLETAIEINTSVSDPDQSINKLFEYILPLITVRK
ncbi:MAG: adenylyl-sulfate kinase [Lentimicrobium sp.]